MPSNCGSLSPYHGKFGYDELLRGNVCCKRATDRNNVFIAAGKCVYNIYVGYIEQKLKTIVFGRKFLFNDVKCGNFTHTIA